MEGQICKNTIFLKNLHGREAYLDIYAKLQDVRHVNLEIKRSNAGAKPQCTRYHSSLMDMKILERSSELHCDLHYRK